MEEVLCEDILCHIANFLPAVDKLNFGQSCIPIRSALASSNVVDKEFEDHCKDTLISNNNRIWVRIVDVDHRHTNKRKKLLSDGHNDGHSEEIIHEIIPALISKENMHVSEVLMLSTVPVLRIKWQTNGTWRICNQFEEINVSGTVLTKNPRINIMLSGVYVNAGFVLIHQVQVYVKPGVDIKKQRLATRKSQNIICHVN